MSQYAAASRRRRWAWLWVFGACGCAGGLETARRPALEIGAQSLAALSVDDETRGGGVGAALEVSLPVRELPSLRGQLLARARAGALVGAGMAWLLEAGVAYRLRGFERWQPDAGLSLGLMTGDLVRTINRQGELSNGPLLLQAGLNPLRCSLARGWVSALGIKAGPSLRSGAPPLAVSLTLLEVGSRF